MPPRAERSPRRLAARGMAVALAALVAMPAYLSIPPSWRSAVVRLVCAGAVAAVAMRARRWAAGPGGAVSLLDAPPPPAAEAELDARFLALRDDVIHGTRSRRYFDVILWPRLTALATGPLPRPATRRGVRPRGPALASLERLVSRIEDER